MFTQRSTLFRFSGILPLVLCVILIGRDDILSGRAVAQTEVRFVPPTIPSMRHLPGDHAPEGQTLRFYKPVAKVAESPDLPATVPAASDSAVLDAAASDSAVAKGRSDIRELLIETVLPSPPTSPASIVSSPTTAFPVSVLSTSQEAKPQLEFVLPRANGPSPARTVAQPESTEIISGQSDDRSRVHRTERAAEQTVRPASPRASVPEAEPLVSPQDQARIDAIVSGALPMEKEGRWFELLTYYESALKTYRNNPTLQQKYRMARRHYDIVRRYYDTSFLNHLLAAGVADNLVLFDEVIAKIQTNHIDAPKWGELFHFGLQDFEVALGERIFLKQNNIEHQASRIPAFQKQMHAMIDTWQIGSRDEMKNAVLHVTQLAQKELGLNPSAVLLEFLCGVTNSLDPHTAFLTKNQLNDTYSTINGDFVGLGVELKSDRQSLIIFRVIGGSPAQEAGLKGGDRILSVDGQTTQGLDTDRAADLLQGEIGTTARLYVQSATSQPRMVDVPRRRIKVPSVEDIKMLNDYLGYLKLNCFQSTTTAEMREALWNLHGQGMRCVVVDLRHNPGGLLPVSVEVANLFIEKGVIVSTRVHPQDPGTPYMATQSGTWPVPLIVLIDEESASASEIFAGAIRDHGRGVIVGKRSYGKGTVQMVHRLFGASKTGEIAGLRLTVEKFYSPGGISCSGIGVSPDVEIDSRAVASGAVPNAPPNASAMNGEPRQHIAARPVDGRISAPAPIALAPSSAPNDPCIVKAVETARRMMSTAAAAPSRN